MFIWRFLYWPDMGSKTSEECVIVQWTKIQGKYHLAFVFAVSA